MKIKKILKYWIPIPLYNTPINNEVCLIIFKYFYNKAIIDVKWSFPIFGPLDIIYHGISITENILRIRFNLQFIRIYE
jgi:hypothetical protein